MRSFMEHTCKQMRKRFFFHISFASMNEFESLDCTDFSELHKQIRTNEHTHNERNLTCCSPLLLLLLFWVISRFRSRSPCNATPLNSTHVGDQCKFVVSCGFHLTRLAQKKTFAFVHTNTITGFLQAINNDHITLQFVFNFRTC